MIRERFKKVTNRISKKKLILVLALILILAVAARATIAWFTAQSPLLSNSFETVEITCQIDEEFIDEVKRNVRIQNTGTMGAYIRVALIPLRKDNNNIVSISTSLSECNIDWGDEFGTTWVLGNDGYYYCITPVNTNAYTPILINEFTVNLQDDYDFELQIVAQAIQALPDSAVVDAWSPCVITVNSDRTLEVVQ